MANCEKSFTIADTELSDIEGMDSLAFEKKLFGHIEKSFNSVWNSKHCSKDFNPNFNQEIQAKLPVMNKLSDMFNFEQATPYDVKMGMRSLEEEPPELSEED